MKFPLGFIALIDYTVTDKDTYSIYVLTHVLNLYIPNIIIYTSQIKGGWHQNSFPLFITLYEAEGTYFH